MRTIKSLIISTLTLGLSVIIASFGIAYAASATTTNKLASIQTRAANEIDQRLTALNILSTQVTGSTKLNSTDKASLTSMIATEVSGLTDLKSTIAADTTADQASTDEATIFTDYRVYAVVIPKVELLTIADNQQSNEAKLVTLASTLQTKITADQTAGDDVTLVQDELTTMKSETTNAQQISSTIEGVVSPILPANWNANHSIFSGDRSQLNTAYQDNQTAGTDATTIANMLKTLKSSTSTKNTTVTPSTNS
jgi:cell pole-organizing protein PopZ